jgi:hypothetical protein
MSLLFVSAYEQNFVVSIVEAQLQGKLEQKDGSPNHTAILITEINDSFTIIFAVELLINMYANWFTPFITNPWSIFDLFGVTLSLVTLGPLDLPISILRALRVVRLFGRLKALKKILAALTASIFPMCNAFLIMLIVAMICK